MEVPAELLLVHLRSHLRIPILTSRTLPSSATSLHNPIYRVLNADKCSKCSSFEFNTHGRLTIPPRRTVPPQFEYIVQKWLLLRSSEKTPQIPDPLGPPLPFTAQNYYLRLCIFPLYFLDFRFCDAPERRLAACEPLERGGCNCEEEDTFKDLLDRELRLSAFGIPMRRGVYSYMAVDVTENAWWCRLKAGSGSQQRIPILLTTMMCELHLFDTNKRASFIKPPM